MEYIPIKTSEREVQGCLFDNVLMSLSIKKKIYVQDDEMRKWLAGQIRGQVSVCRAWNALPNNVEHKVEASMEPFRSPAGDRTWVP